MEERAVRHLLITGGAGFIGSSFIRYLLQTPDLFSGVVVNLDALTYAGNRDNLIEIEDDPRYHFVHGDIRQSSLVEHLCLEYEIDTIVHFAAESHVDRSIEGPKAFVETNVLGTFSLLEVVRKYPHIHFHHVSTDEVFGSLGKKGAFTEQSPYAPRSPYSASKAASDHFVRAYAETYHLSTCLSNCSNNFGPYQFPEKLIPLMLLRAVRGEPLPIYGKGENVRDWLFVNDHVEALWLLLQQGKRGETYNIGGGTELTNLEVVETVLKRIASHLNTPIDTLRNQITYVTDRPGHDFRYAIDATKIREELGRHPRHTFIEALDITIDWYVSHPEWVERVEKGEYKEWIQRQYQKSKQT